MNIPYSTHPNIDPTRGDRLADDSTNMQFWNTHNAFRACLVCADGYMVVWDYKQAMFLSKFNPLGASNAAAPICFILTGAISGPCRR